MTQSVYTVRLQSENYRNEKREIAIVGYLTFPQAIERAGKYAKAEDKVAKEGTHKGDLALKMKIESIEREEFDAIF